MYALDSLTLSNLDTDSVTSWKDILKAYKLGNSDEFVKLKIFSHLNENDLCLHSNKSLPTQQFITNRLLGSTSQLVVWCVHQTPLFVRGFSNETQNVSLRIASTAVNTLCSIQFLQAALLVLFIVIEYTHRIHSSDTLIGFNWIPLCF